MGRSGDRGKTDVIRGLPPSVAGAEGACDLRSSQDKCGLLLAPHEVEEEMEKVRFQEGTPGKLVIPGGGAVPPAQRWGQRTAVARGADVCLPPHLTTPPCQRTDGGDGASFSPERGPVLLPGAFQKPDPVRNSSCLLPPSRLPTFRLPGPGPARGGRGRRASIAPAVINSGTQVPASALSGK